MHSRQSFPTAHQAHLLAAKLVSVALIDSLSICCVHPLPPSPHRPNNHHYPWLRTIATLLFLIGLLWDGVFGRTDETCSRLAHTSIVGSLSSENSRSCRCSAGLRRHWLRSVCLSGGGSLHQCFRSIVCIFLVSLCVNAENGEWKEKRWWG